jgi:tRNA dimethylallyltransferase
VTSTADQPFADCWFLTGPTASGKSALALPLAESLGCEIIALDSMTLYRGMDIGSAKPTADDQRRVRHHLLDVLDPSEPSSLADYLKRAKAAAEEIRSRGKQPLFVGGTPLYLKACLRGMFEGPGADADLRRRLEEEAEQIGVPALHARLAEIDPKAAERILVNDLRRIVRALEIYTLTGRPISEWQQEFDRPADPPPKVACIVRPREELRSRIVERVTAMMNAGWIEEAKRLFERDPPPGREARQAVGYGEIIEHLAGKMSFDELVETVTIRTRQFAKRQMTWFRHLEEIRFFETSEQDDPIRLLDALTEFFRNRAG